MTEVAIAAAVVILVSAVCSLFEAVLYSVPASHVETLVAAGSRAGRQLQKLRADVQRPISAILSLNTIANTGGAAIAGAAAAEAFGEHWLGWFSAGLTLAILMLSEIIPKTTGVVYSRPLSRLIAWPLALLVSLFRPLIWVTTAVTSAISRGRDSETVSDQELIVMTRLGLKRGSIQSHEAEIIQNILSLKKFTVRDLMTPRVVMYALEVSTVLEDLRGDLETLRHTRIPVYGDSVDDVVGFVHRRDLLTAMAEDRWNDTVEKMTRPVQFVSDSVSADHLLPMLMHQHQQMFVVLDEFGGVAGLITMEDVIEEIIGKEIVDEFDEIADLRQLAQMRRQTTVDESIATGRRKPSGPASPAPPETRP